MKNLKPLIKLEEFFLFTLGVYLFSILEYEWWLFPLLILVPDLSMFGYLLGKKVGAYTYNFFHFRGLAVLFILFGASFGSQELFLIGVILFSHSSLDRVFGYGFKYESGFADTHMGKDF
jgi:hypothetical protein